MANLEDIWEAGRGSRTWERRYVPTKLHFERLVRSVATRIGQLAGEIWMDIDDPDLGDIESISTIHHALRSSRRRTAIILVALKLLGPKSAEPSTVDEISDSISVRTLSRQIVALEQDIPIGQATGDAYHNVYTSLIQTHLPRLQAIRAIKYNPDRKEIRPGENLPALAVIATISTPIAMFLFNDSSVDQFQQGNELMED